jgi:NAD(P)-dependent dehydrogenase (short-subunit alcohol dehydrogenase family)
MLDTRGQHDRKEKRAKPRVDGGGYRGSGVLFNKVALITGGDSGIGRAAAVLCAREGAEIAIVYPATEQRGAEHTAEAVASEGRRILLLPGDVRHSSFCRRAVQRTVARFGHLDILVNTAAYQQQQASIADIDDAQLKRTFETNIFGYFYMARAALAHMRRGASIINVGSLAGLEGCPHLVDYAATTGAIHAFTKSLAANVADSGIRVNAIAPAVPPSKRPAQPEEIAPSIVFFASPIHSSYITGEVLTLLGGESTAA